MALVSPGVLANRERVSRDAAAAAAGPQPVANIIAGVGSDQAATQAILGTHHDTCKAAREHEG
jgi:hypothetical protein